MDEDIHLESDYEDRYTIQGDIDSEDNSYIEDDEDDSEYCGYCSQLLSTNCDCDMDDDPGIHPDSPSLQDTMGEWPSYGN